MAIETTLSIIKPDAVERNLVGKIIARFEEEGLTPVGIRRVHLSRAEAGANGVLIRRCERKNFDSLLWALITVFQVHFTNHLDEFFGKKI